MRIGAKVTVRMPRGENREGKYIGKETARGEWYIIQPHDKAAQPFKARPSMVTPL